MLVLSRRIDESLKIGEDIEILIKNISRKQIIFGIKAPRKLNIVRAEIKEKYKDKNIKK